ncbi:MAG: hypothetical protein MHM6MM_006286, partial [Cercozoa sp. M6MM]
NVGPRCANHVASLLTWQTALIGGAFAVVAAGCGVHVRGFVDELSLRLLQVTVVPTDESDVRAEDTSNCTGHADDVDDAKSDYSDTGDLVSYNDDDDDDDDDRIQSGNNNNHNNNNDDNNNNSNNHGDGTNATISMEGINVPIDESIDSILSRGNTPAPSDPDSEVPGFDASAPN